MFSHEPANYRCPFCLLVSGTGNGVNSPDDIVRRNGSATAFIAPKWWPTNHGHVLVVPNAHHENIYDLPRSAGHAVHDLVQDLAVAIRLTYECAGTSVRQHNEPAGSQDVWHYHVHVFPRFVGDNLYRNAPREGFVPRHQRAVYASRLRRYFVELDAGAR